MRFGAPPGVKDDIVGLSQTERWCVGGASAGVIDTNPWSHRALLAPSARTVAVAVMLVAPFFPIHGLGVDLCLLHAGTGLPCPGCGMTRALAALSQGHWSDAVALQPFALLAWPTLFVIAVTTLVPGWFPKLRNWVEAHARSVGRVYRCCFIAFLAFGALRFALFFVLGERFP
jgi:hypothetical protein